MNLVVLAGLGVVLAVVFAWPAPLARGLLRGPPPATGGAGERPGGVPGLSARRRLLYAAGAGLALPALVPAPWALLAGPVLAIVAWLLVGRIEDGAVASTRADLSAELPQALTLLGTALSAGSPIRGAVAEVASVSPAATRRVLELVLGHVQVGRGEEEAWLALSADPIAAPVWGRPAKDLARTARSGVAVAEILAEHVARSRADRVARVERQARVVGVKSVLPLMVCFLPAFVLVGVVPIIAGLISTVNL